MKSNEKKHLAQTLLSEVAVIMLLDDGNLKGQINHKLKGRFTEIVDRQSGPVIKDMYTIKNIMSRFVQKLVECDDPAMVAQVMLVIDGINTGSVYIAADGQQIIES